MMLVYYKLMCFTIISGGCESATHTCTCRPGWTGIGCEYADCAGTPDCNDHGMCDDAVDPPECR